MTEFLAPRVLLYHGTGLIDTIIRWQTWGSVAHAAIWDPNSGLIYEAVLEGVIKRQANATDFVTSESYTVNDIVNWTKTLAFLDAQLKKPYDLRGLFQFLARSGGDTRSRWFCSDLVFEAIKQGGVELLARVPQNKVSPEQLRRSPLLIPG